MTETTTRPEAAHDLITADLADKYRYATNDYAWASKPGNAREERIAELRAAAETAGQAYWEHEANYTGWSRFFLVPGGHIHSTRDCSTCNNGRVATVFGWLPELSGMTEADAVEAHGEILCSVCFPTAPVAWTTGVAKAVQEARDERAVKSAERAAKKAAKALYADDPERALRTSDGDRLTTIAAAKSWLTDSAEWEAIYVERGDAERRHPSYSAADTQLVAETLAARTGSTAADELAAAAKRAAKRR